MQTLLELATQIKQETPDRETRAIHCSECKTETDHIRVYPYEYRRLGYLGERSAYVCPKCGYDI